VRSLEAPTGPAASPWHDGPMCRTGRSLQARRPSTPEPAQSAQTGPSERGRAPAVGRSELRGASSNFLDYSSRLSAFGLEMSNEGKSGQP